MDKDFKFLPTSISSYLHQPPPQRIILTLIMEEAPFSSSIFSFILMMALISLAYLPKSQQQQCSSSTTNGNPPPPEVRAGYWLSRSSHHLPMSTINSSLYTHLYYYYDLSLDVTVNGVLIISPTPAELSLLTTFSATVKSSNPSVKTLLCIATDASLSAVAADRDLRASFIRSAVELARAKSFDGLDLCWQLPSSAADMANLGVLLAESRARIQDQDQEHPLLLTASVYFANHLFEGSSEDLDLYYPVDAISSNLDWINVLSFGFHKEDSINSTVTAAADAALFDTTSHFSASYGITSWMDAGIPSCKLVMGIPLYGRSWILKNKEKNGPGAEVVAAGPRQKMSNQTGIMGFSEIEQLLQQIKEPASSSSVYVYDDRMVTAYLHSGGLWVSFDSPQVVEKKIEFAVRQGLLGYFLWPISFDDSIQTLSAHAMEMWLEHKNGSAYTQDESGFNREYSSPPVLGKTPEDHDVPPPPSAGVVSSGGSVLGRFPTSLISIYNNNFFSFNPCFFSPFLTFLLNKHV